MPAFTEMQVRNEIDLLWRRYKALVITTSGLAGLPESFLPLATARLSAFGPRKIRLVA